MHKFLFLFLTIGSPIFGETLYAQRPFMQLAFQAPKQMQVGTSIKLKVRVQYYSTTEQTGTISLSLFNQQTKNSVDGWFLNIFPFQYFTTLQGEFFETEFPFTVPNDFSGAFELAVIAKAGTLSDSVRYTIPTIQKQ